ncbi:hypothetical protein PoB_002349900 [Plakobranchus ocellatus]|uniref:Uncharacterized protein n=1 Tax=Plakobranchus ocellatus TaxID=259542 RepID=A0AAV3ZRG1_9GAST|nr:hypothetical protein PoB_002349900 [Plakobranchus ocellatus]
MVAVNEMEIHYNYVVGPAASLSSSDPVQQTFGKFGLALIWNWTVTISRRNTARLEHFQVFRRFEALSQF